MTQEVFYSQNLIDHQCDVDFCWYTLVLAYGGREADFVICYGQAYHE